MPPMSDANDRANFGIHRLENGNSLTAATDTLAVEEPLEIRIACGKRHQAVSITMRTPGDDAELAAGFLFTESIVTDAGRIREIRHCGRFPNRKNTVRVEIDDFEGIDLKRLERNFYTTSSCGVCGKSSLEALASVGVRPIESNGFAVSAQLVGELPAIVRNRQTVFEATGGLHAAALCDAGGGLIDLKEDVGRHNAVDKLIGRAFLDGRLPLSESVLFLSGRASFELIQKAATAGIPVVCAVGAPSSLAVEAALNFGITLVGFVRDGRFNIYSGIERIRTTPAN